MSLIIQSNPGAEIDALQIILNNISRLMVQQFDAYEFISQNSRIYLTQLPIFKEKMVLNWRFENVMPHNNIKVCIRPNLSDGIAGNFKVENQRGFVDLLHVINSCNRDKEKLMNYVISDFSFIQMCTIFSTNYTSDIMYLRKLIKSTFSMLPQSILRLITSLKPFLEHRNKSLSCDGVSKTAKLFLEKSMKLLLAIKFNQIKNEDQIQNLKDYSPLFLSNNQIQQKIQHQRIEAHKKLKDCLKFLRLQDTFLKNPANSIESVYKQWIKRNKQPSTKNTKSAKNVNGIKIVEQKKISIERDREGSHCKIILGQYKVIMMISINNQVNKALSEMKKKDGQALISQKILKVQKELQLVKKLLKDPVKIQSKNSIENQLDFITYIKERHFKYVATYYWEYQKKRSQIQTILMDYYPQNLRQMISSQGKLLSTREKLTLIRQITIAVNQLASNYVCHRDLKPENIMLDEHRTPKLIDFGSCCPVNGVGSSYFRVKDTRLLSTPNYYHAFNPDMRVIYRRNQYEQHFLFDAYSLGKIIRDIFEDQLPNLLPNFSGLMSYIIERCLEQNPADRLTYQQMLFLFDNFIQYLDLLSQSTK